MRQVMSSTSSSYYCNGRNLTGCGLRAPRASRRSTTPAMIEMGVGRALARSSKVSSSLDVGNAMLLPHYLRTNCPFPSFTPSPPPNSSSRFSGAERLGVCGEGSTVRTLRLHYLGLSWPQTNIWNFFLPARVPLRKVFTNCQHRMRTNKYGYRHVLRCELNCFLVRFDDESRRCFFHSTHWYPPALESLSKLGGHGVRDR
ncbi:hypothetical protein DFH06DRAFT_273095 [Mycena polygramma]|nr:hypothetical protein DFH06DRAFT_273095 [Mycena polygramma]